MNAPICRLIAAIFTTGALLAASGCAGIDAESRTFAPTEQTRQLDQLIARQQGKVFRSEPYLEMAAGLQTMPRDQAEGLLRTWAHSGKYEVEVVNLCRLLFVKKDGGPLVKAPSREVFDEISWVPGYVRRSQFKGMFGLGGTNGDDWPDWPLAIVNGVPFSIAVLDNGPLTGPPGVPPLPLAPVYLKYCLTEGQWTAQRYTPVNLAERQKALETLLHSPNWKRDLIPSETEYLTYQISETAGPREPEVPIYHGLYPSN